MKKIKSGFSMVELLFVMAVMAALAAIAIPSMSASSDSAALTSMKSDAKHTIADLQAGYVDNQDYSLVVTGSAFTDSDGDGKSDAVATNAVNGKTISVSKNNTITITTDGARPDQFIVSVANSTLSGKFINFDTTADGKIQVAGATDVTFTN